MNNEEKLKDEGFPPGMILLAVILTIASAFSLLLSDGGNIFQKTLALFCSPVLGCVTAYFLYNYLWFVFVVLKALYGISNSFLTDLGIPESMTPSLSIMLALFLIMVIPF